MDDQLTTASITSHQRLYSLDALRGFDMFWIIGGEEIFHSLFKATGSPFWGAISNQFTHPAWNGFHFYDLIFPLFLFIAGGNKCTGFIVHQKFFVWLQHNFSFRIIDCSTGTI